MNEHVFSIIMGMLLGDAAGYPLESLGKGHIRSSLGAIDGFADPAEAQKGHIERWRKPGLLSASGQLSLCAAAATRGRELSAAALISAIGSSGEGGMSGTGPFRGPSRVLRSFLLRAYGGELIIPPSPAGALLPVCAAAAAAVAVNRSPDGGECALYAAGLGGDVDTALGAELLGRAIALCAEGDQGVPGVSFFASRAEELAGWCRENEPILFSAGFNPITAIASAERYCELFKSLERIRTLSAGEALIVAAVNTRLKTPVTRATVDHPLALLPFAVLLADPNLGVPERAIFLAAEEGGCSPVVCSLVGALVAVTADPLEIYGSLFSLLVNRRDIYSLAEKAASGTLSSRDLGVFLSAESSLTSKEAEEREARMRHGKVSASPVRKEGRREQERSLTKHVVESWTKVDKAKWKKERRRMDQEPED